MRSLNWRNYSIILCGAVAALGCRASFAQTSYRAIDLNHGEPYGSAILAVNAGHASGFVIERHDVPHQTHYCRRAAYWTSANAPALKLDFFNFPCSDIRAINGTRQAGSAAGLGGATDYSRPILLDRAHVREVNTDGFEDSAANGVYGDELVGQASGTATGGHVHAVLWSIAKKAVLDLNGTNHLESAALATNGRQQLGWASDEHGEIVHATLWRGMRNSEIDLNPESFDSSYGYAIDAGSQVGVGITHGAAHALLWHGKATDVADLNPAGFIESYATAVSDNRQVGYAIKADLNGHALVWFSKASRYIDLQEYLPPDLTQSYATSIDTSGNIGGYATDTAGTPHAVIWQPVRAKQLSAQTFASTGQ